MESIKIYDEMATFLAQSVPLQIFAYRPSEATQHRFDDLV
jgi:hypothetical protein